MAESDFTNDHQKKGGDEEQKLKYLEFVNTAALHAFFCFSNLYGIAKEKTGPLKSGVEYVENAVKTVVSPVYEQYHDVPVELLKLVDDKVDESVAKLDKTLPPLVKQVSSQAFSVAVKAPEVARGVASEVQRAGLKDTASGIAKNIYTKYEPIAKVLYSKYEPLAEQYAVSAWQSLNRLPLIPHVAQVVVPTAALCSEKYNQTVMVGAERGYRVANYLPLVPTEKIAKVFGLSEDELPPVVNENNATVSAH